MCDPTIHTVDCLSGLAILPLFAVLSIVVFLETIWAVPKLVFGPNMTVFPVRPNDGLVRPPIRRIISIQRFESMTQLLLLLFTTRYMVMAYLTFSWSNVWPGGLCGCMNQTATAASSVPVTIAPPVFFDYAYS